ncbi:unnamed protein product [Ectocarpus fasciculatus]
MLRRHFKQRDAFRETASAQIKQLNAALDLATSAMDEPWRDLENGWEIHQQHLLDVGVRPTTGNEGVLRLNIGGVPANVHRSLIAEAEGFKGSVLSALFEQMWDERVPRDANGRIVLDESPACMKHIIHTLLRGGCTTRTKETASLCDFRSGAGPSAAVAAHDEPYLLYISHVLGLSNVIPTCPNTKGMVVAGGTTIANPLQLPQWSSLLRSWCPGDPAGLHLLYRASRDGFSTRPFQQCVRGVCETITLIRVKSDDGRTDSVVGGFSDIEIVPKKVGRETGNQRSSSAFLFLLDSPGGGFPTAKKWGIKEDEENCAIHWPETADVCAGPAFGLEDMCVTFTESEGQRGSSGCTLSTGGEFYDVDEDSPFVDLDGKQVAEIEVFRVDETARVEDQDVAPVATTPPQSSIFPDKRQHFLHPDRSADEIEEAYALQFGSSLAELLMEEQMALAFAQTELEEAKKRAVATARALAIVYGPGVASARIEENAVVELSVRGMSVTTLRSTLEVCPGSAFSTWLGADRPVACGDEGEANVEGLGRTRGDRRRNVDCDPSCFSKILDVLRMRKRSAWVTDDQQGALIREAGGGHTIRIPIPESDRACFKSLVHTLFPECEDFVMDMVEPWDNVPVAMMSAPYQSILKPMPEPLSEPTSDKEVETSPPERATSDEPQQSGPVRRPSRRTGITGQLFMDRLQQIPRRASLRSTTSAATTSDSP